MMTASSYAGWVELHCEATAGSVEAAASLLSDVVRQQFEGMNATYAELSECTARLIGGLRSPKFANEHTGAVLGELRILRSERSTAGLPDHSDAYYDAPRCPLCGGDGLVSVPLFDCVQHGRLVPLKGYAAPSFGSVLCDTPGCAKGLEVRNKEQSGNKRRPAYGDYCRRFGGIDLAGLVAAYDREQMRLVRRMPCSDAGNGVATVMAKLKRTLAGDAEASGTGGVL